MKIVYTIAGTYRAAGMERILADKANYLAGKGYEITIVTTEQKGRPDAFPLAPEIHRVDLGIGYEDNNGQSLFSKLTAYPTKQRHHRKKLKTLISQLRPDIVVSMFCGDERFLPQIKDGSKKVLEVHFSRFKRIQYGRKGLWGVVDRYRSRQDEKVIRRFDKFVALTEEDFGYWGNPQNGAVIPNFISEMPSSFSDLSGNVVLAAGRYSYQKGFDRLISAWSIVCKALPENSGWKLRFVGDGELKEQMQMQVNESGIQESVIIGGVEQDMAAVYRNASIYALSSHYEGLPMVLLEAQAYGLPIVAFDCMCGPKDVVTDGKDGFLVQEGDTDKLASAILKIICDKDLAVSMSRNARNNAARWDKERVMQQWIHLFEEIS